MTTDRQAIADDRMLEARGALAVALAKAQSEIAPTERDAQADLGKYKFDYLSAEQTIGLVREPLARNGLALLTSATLTEEVDPATGKVRGMAEVSGRLIHAGGGSMHVGCSRGFTTGDGAGAITKAFKQLLVMLLLIPIVEDAAEKVGARFKPAEPTETYNRQTGAWESVAAVHAAAAPAPIPNPLNYAGGVPTSEAPKVEAPAAVNSPISAKVAAPVSAPAPVPAPKVEAPAAPTSRQPSAEELFGRAEQIMRAFVVKRIELGMSGDQCKDVIRHALPPEAWEADAIRFDILASQGVAAVQKFRENLSAYLGARGKGQAHELAITDIPGVCPF